MKLGLTIFYRLLWAIQIGWCASCIGFFYDSTGEYVYLIVGLVGALFVHFVFISPTGMKLKENHDA
jgi:uncharacterized membrane protein YeaQ/YmgE (transglycosylase-associated protein family)